MAKAFLRASERLNDTGRLVIVFANKSVDAWETLVGALIRGGAEVTASWPIQTEMPNRTRGQRIRCIVKLGLDRLPQASKHGTHQAGKNQCWSG